MNKTTLCFPSIVELIDFSLAMQTRTYEVNRSRIAITAVFTEADIELAIKAYGAKKTETV
ncbi:MAG: hypothetical protein JWP88_2327 [Flaviaesturariibacter sp.]|nr:hypothetical protein [Flaviaesturariibacter sp.]